MIAFIHIYKTGGQTFEMILASTYGVNHCHSFSPDFDNQITILTPTLLKELRDRFPNLRSIAGHDVRPIEEGESVGDLKWVTFIRHPLERTASHFQQCIRRDGKSYDFRAWIKQEKQHNRQTKMLAGSDNLDNAIEFLNRENVFVGLTEFFDESLLFFKRWLDSGLSIGYRQINVTKNNQMAKDLVADVSSRKLLENANQLDLALYSYIKEEMFPVKFQDYGDSFSNDLKDIKSKKNRFGYLNVGLSFLKNKLVYDRYINQMYL